MDNAPKAPGRKRCEATEDCILSTTLELLEEAGFAKLTIEGIAQRAGVGKTTIYRWWPDKTRLVMDAFLRTVSAEISFPDTGSVREDFRKQMRALVRLMNGSVGRTLAAVIGGGQMDEAVAAAFREHWLEKRRAAARAVLQRGVERGELPRGANLDLLLDALYGPVYLRLLVRHQPLTAAFTDALVELVFASI